VWTRKILKQVWWNNLFDKNFLWHLFYHLWWITAKGTIAADNEQEISHWKYQATWKHLECIWSDSILLSLLNEVSNSGFKLICNFKRVNIKLYSIKQLVLEYPFNCLSTFCHLTIGGISHMWFELMYGPKSYIYTNTDLVFFFCFLSLLGKKRSISSPTRDHDALSCNLLLHPVSKQNKKKKVEHNTNMPFSV